MIQQELNLTLPDGPACRIYQVIRYKGYKLSEFASVMGWTRQRLNTYLIGGSFGMKPATEIIQKFPDISARWLLSGDGIMLDLSHHAKAVHDWQTLSHLIHVMTQDDRTRIDSGLGYSDADIARWTALADAFQKEAEHRFMDQPQNEENEG